MRGLLHAAEDAVRLFLVVLVLGPVGAALGIVPEVGDKLTALAGNLALAAAGAAATVIARRVWKNSVGDVTEPHRQVSEAAPIRTPRALWLAGFR